MIGLDETTTELQDRPAIPQPLHASGKGESDMHELGNLLFVIETSGEVLLDTFDEADPRRQFVTKIMLAGRRARDVVQELHSRGFGAARDRSRGDPVDGSLNRESRPRPATGSDETYRPESRSVGLRADEEREASQARPKTILVVEDDSAVRELVCRMLSAEGYNVLQAATGSEAMEIFDRHQDPIDLVVTDVVMPQMSGIELLTQVKARSEGLKVLYMSGHSEEVVNSHGMVDLVANYIPKPFSRRQLAARVRQLLGGAEEQS